MASSCLRCALRSAILVLIISCIKASPIDTLKNYIEEREPLSQPEVLTHCGRSKMHDTHSEYYLSKRIVGGKESEFGEWPWLVSMMLRTGGEGGEFEHLCGGTLIAPQWVVTAAHCFESVWDERLTDEPAFWRARVGEHNLFDELTHHVDVDVTRVIFHPARNAPETFNIDIALVKLANPMKLGGHVNIACLPDRQDVFPTGTKCVTAGWGHQKEGGNVSSVVRHVQVPLVSNALCNKMYATLAHLMAIKIPADMTCAGFDFGGHDACQYDSGGPMVCLDPTDETWLLSGIVSLGYGCARPGFPGIYTQVAYFSDWIQETIALN